MKKKKKSFWDVIFNFEPKIKITPLSKSEYPVIHLWQPMSFHEEQYIVGNREGLIRLIQLLDDTLKKGKSKEEFFLCDGEGHDIIIHCTEDVDHIAVPYTESYAKEHRENAIYPWDMEMPK